MICSYLRDSQILWHGNRAAPLLGGTLADRSDAILKSVCVQAVFLKKQNKSISPGLSVHVRVGETLETHLLQQVSEKEAHLFWELGCEVALAG